MPYVRETIRTSMDISSVCKGSRQKAAECLKKGKWQLYVKYAEAGIGATRWLGRVRPTTTG